MIKFNNNQKLINNKKYNKNNKIMMISKMQI